MIRLAKAVRGPWLLLWLALVFCFPALRVSRAERTCAQPVETAEGPVSGMSEPGAATLCSVSTPATGRVLTRMGLKGKIAQVGHDLQVETLNNIKDGATTASLSQNPYKQGYEAVKQLYEFLTKGTLPTVIDTGIVEVNQSNADEWLQKIKDGEPVG